MNKINDLHKDNTNGTRSHITFFKKLKCVLIKGIISQEI